MFAPYSGPFASSHGSAARSLMYHEVGVQTAVSEASAHQLVAMLYDGLLDAIAQARGAIQSNQVEARTRAISRATRIVDEGLKSALNLAEGGELARRLDKLYGYVAMRLTEANLRNDAEALIECAELISPLREAWTSIAAQVSPQMRTR